MSDTFTITVNGTERDLKMSFGLLNSVCRVVGDVDGAAMISMDPALRQAVLEELLSTRDTRGKITERVDLDTLDVEPDAIVDLLDWAGNHAMDFFLKGLEKAKALQDRNMSRIKALMPTSPGSAS